MEAAQLWLSLPVRVGEPGVAGQLQLGLGTSSVAGLLSDPASAGEGWLAGVAVGWPARAGMVRAGLLTEQWAMTGMPAWSEPGLQEAASLPPAAARWRSWVVEASLARPRTAAAGPASPKRSGESRLAARLGQAGWQVAARLAFRDTWGAVERLDQEGPGVGGLREQEAGAWALQSRELAVGVVLGPHGDGSDGSGAGAAGLSRWGVGLLAAGGSELGQARSSLARWWAGLPAGASLRHQTLELSHQVLGAAGAVCWSRGGVDLGVSAGPFWARGWGSRAQVEQSVEGATASGSWPVSWQAGGHWLRLELRLHPGRRLSYRLVGQAAWPAALWAGEAGERAGWPGMAQEVGLPGWSPCQGRLEPVVVGSSMRWAALATLQL
ncbi:MAG TPA: hypothetical protein VIL11_02865 [Limnochordales bacterium]